MKDTWLEQQKRNSNIGCRYCGSPRDLSKDHIHPKSRGGRNEITNYQVLCKFCNQKKANLTDYEVASTFRAIKERGVWYEFEKKLAGWLDYIEIKREEYRKPPLNFG